LRCHRWRYRSAKFVDVHLPHLIVSSFAPHGIDLDSLHRHHEVELFSFRSSSRIRGIPLDPACQCTARMMSKTQLTSCKRARSAEARSPYRILAVAYVLRLFRGLYSIPHCISAGSAKETTKNIQFDHTSRTCPVRWTLSRLLLPTSPRRSHTHQQTWILLLISLL